MYLHLWTKQFIMYNVYDAKQDQDYVADFKGYLSRNKNVHRQKLRFLSRIRVTEKNLSKWLPNVSSRESQCLIAICCANQKRLLENTQSVYIKLLYTQNLIESLYFSVHIFGQDLYPSVFCTGLIDTIIHRSKRNL